MRHEGRIIPHDVVVGPSKWRYRHFLLRKVDVSDAWIVHEGTSDIEVLVIVLVQHGSSDVRDVSSGIRFPSYIDLELFDPKFVLEVSEETEELLGDFDLICGSGSAD